MVCPKCSSDDLKVNESRDVDSGTAVRRRRECIVCKYRFTTYERIENPGLLVVKRSGGKEAYDREKILQGVTKALEKRSFSTEDIVRFVEKIEQKIYLLAQDEVESSVIGDIVLDELKSIDEVAYLRFVSVYKSFDDLETFGRELDFIKGRSKD